MILKAMACYLCFSYKRKSLNYRFLTKANRGQILRIWAAAYIWLVPLEIVFNVSRFKPALNWNRFLVDLRLRRGLNLLNWDSVSYYLSNKRFDWTQNRLENYHRCGFKIIDMKYFKWFLKSHKIKCKKLIYHH